MVCEGKRKLTMSGVNALNSSNVSFSGSEEKSAKKLKVAGKSSTPKVKSAKIKKKDDESIGKKLAQPVVDEFKKAYGEDAEATPSLVADFIADNAVKIGVAVAGGALLLAKSRKYTNGFTSALKENLTKARQATSDKEKIGLFKSSIGTIKKTFSDVKSNNIKDAAAKAEAAAKNGTSSLTESVKDAILKPTEFKADSGLGKFIDKASVRAKKLAEKFGIKMNAETCADSIKKGLGKVGISDGAALADTGIAGAATVILGSGANEIAGDVTGKDNAGLANQARIEKFEKVLNQADKLADTLGMFAG